MNPSKSMHTFLNLPGICEGFDVERCTGWVTSRSASIKRMYSFTGTVGLGGEEASLSDEDASLMASNGGKMGSAICSTDGSSALVAAFADVSAGRSAIPPVLDRTRVSSSTSVGTSLSGDAPPSTLELETEPNNASNVAAFSGNRIEWVKQSSSTERRSYLGKRLIWIH